MIQGRPKLFDEGLLSSGEGVAPDSCFRRMTNQGDTLSRAMGVIDAKKVLVPEGAGIRALRLSASCFLSDFDDLACRGV
jgi:hypothetical protein